MAYRRRRKHSKRNKTDRVWAMVLIPFAVVFVGFIVIVTFFPRVFNKGIRYIEGTLGVQHVDASRHEKLDYDGIDVSRYQGKIDWERVAEDTCVQFVYVKATEGSTLVDEMYHHNMKKASACYLNVGSYHYVTSRSSIRSQFKNFTKAMSRHRQILKPVLDIEADGVRAWNKKQAQDSLQLFVDLLKAKYGVTPIIYSYSRYYNEMLAPKFNKLHLFIAKYSKEEPVVEGVGKHNLWQHTDQGIVDGISMPVDLNVFAEGTTLEDILMPVGSQ